MALGYDEGTVVIKIGREEPVASMDSGGKVIWARQNEIQTVNVRSLSDGEAEVSHATAAPCHPVLHSCTQTPVMHPPVGIAASDSDDQDAAASNALRSASMRAVEVNIWDRMITRLPWSKGPST